MSSVAEVAADFGGRPGSSGWMGYCPLHNDAKPSLSIGEGRGGKILLKCFAGCPQERLIAEVHRRGLSLDGVPGSHWRERQPANRVVARYDYRDENGVLRHQSVRWIPKRFTQRRPDPDKKGEWIDDLDGVAHLPYRLPELLAEPNGPVWIVEGEKDCNRLVSEGLLATTNAGGAGNSKVWSEFARKWFEGRRCLIVPDNDEAGRRHAEVVAAALDGVARRVKIVTVPDLREHGDASDFLDSGHTVRELRRLAHYAPEWKPTEEGAAASAGSEAPDDDGSDAEIAWLAALPPLEYERQRNEAAGRLCCRVSVLDKEVEKRRVEIAPKESPGQGRQLGIAEIEPWPDPVDGGELLGDLSLAIRDYLVLEPHQRDALALWVTFTHAFDAFEFAPKINVTSAEKRSGKTRLIEVLERVVNRPLPTSGISGAALLRLIEACRPTLLLDEVDALTRANAEMAETLRGLLNSGFSRATARFVKNVPVSNGGWEAAAFSTWCPQVLSGIGELPDTVADRSIRIEMKRKLPNEKVSRLRGRDGEDLRLLAKKAARWASDHLDELRDADPDAPSQLNDRAVDAWSPLLAIAAAAGGDWPERARGAAVRLSGAGEDAETTATMLLADLRDLFEWEDDEELTSEEIVSALVGLQDRPWAEFSRGKPLSAHTLARLLKPFGVKPGQRWGKGRNRRRYCREAFEDAFARYLPPQSAISLGQADSAAFEASRTAREEENLALRNRVKPKDPAHSSGLALSRAGTRGNSSWWRGAIARQTRRNIEERRRRERGEMDASADGI